MFHWLLEQKLKVESDRNPGNPDVSGNKSQNVEECGNISTRNCAICLEVFAPHDVICNSNNPDCDHAYHHECILKWLLKNEDCPCCRRDYLTFAQVRGSIWTAWLSIGENFKVYCCNPLLNHSESWWPNECGLSRYSRKSQVLLALRSHWINVSVACMFACT